MEQREYGEYEINRTGGDGKGSGVVKSQDIALLQEKLFETLVCFAEFCEKWNIKYILSGGTLIGAARNQDFIAWDDDVDVAVLREDFDKLFELWDRHGDKENFSLYRTKEDYCAYAPIGILRNNNTVFIREYEEGLQESVLGVKIDIEPFDEIPEDSGRRRIQMFYARLYTLFLTQRKPRQHSKIIRIGSSILLSIFKGKRVRNYIIRICEKQVKKYNGTGCSKVAINGFGWVQNIKDITETTKLPFHGKEFRVPLRYDAFLRRWYGDYLTKPVVGERIPKDTPAYYDLNMSYQDYLESK